MNYNNRTIDRIHQYLCKCRALYLVSRPTLPGYNKKILSYIKQSTTIFKLAKYTYIIEICHIQNIKPTESILAGLELAKVGKLA